MDIREEFEKLTEIAEIFKGLHPTIIWFCDKSNKYATSFSGFNDRVIWLNGAWYAFQEQQKKKDLAISKIKAFEKNTSADQVLFLNDLLIELKGILK